MLILIALLALIGAALKLSGGLAAAYWILFGIFSFVSLIEFIINVIRKLED